MIEGTRVILNSSLGEIERIVAEDLGEILLVCHEDEWNRARSAGEKPVSIGFRRTEVVQEWADARK